MLKPIKIALGAINHVTHDAGTLGTVGMFVLVRVIVTVIRMGPKHRIIVIPYKSVLVRNVGLHAGRGNG
jgi:hypothetical protein